MLGGQDMAVELPAELLSLPKKLGIYEYGSGDLGEFLTGISHLEHSMMDFDHHPQVAIDDLELVVPGNLLEDNTALTIR